MSTTPCEFTVVVLFDSEIQSMFQIASDDNYHLCLVPPGVADGDVRKAIDYALDEVVSAFRADAISQDLASSEDAAEERVSDDSFRVAAVFANAPYPCYLG